VENAIQHYKKDKQNPVNFAQIIYCLIKKENPGSLMFGNFRILLQNNGINAGTRLTGRKKAEEELQESKEFAENLLETAKSIVVTLDAKANISTFNQYAEELTGY